MRPQAASTSPLGVECRNHRHNDDRALPDLLLLDDDDDDDSAGFDLSLMLPSLHCASPSPFIHCCVHHHIAPSLALDYVDLLQESRSDVRFRASPFDLRRLCDVRRPFRPLVEDRTASYGTKARPHAGRLTGQLQTAC